MLSLGVNGICEGHKETKMISIEKEYEAINKTEDCCLLIAIRLSTEG